MRTMILLFSLFAIGATLSNCSKTSTTTAPELETVQLRIEGMMCGEGCPPQVRGMLESVAGVESCDIDFPTKTATVQVAKGTDPDALTSAVTGRFSATLAGS